MRRFLLILLLSFTALWVRAQAFNNEWIDYSKSYYKFKVGRTGLYRINQNILPTELKNIPAEQFQLWRNGVEISIYTSVPSGALPANGYIEFWGEKNDGKPDKALYKNPANQLSDALSLETDTAAYFLTVNATGNNLRIINDVNDVAGNTLSPESYFMYDYSYNYQQQINWGRAVNFGEYVYSSTYDVGEFWSSSEIHINSPLQLSAGDLHVATNGTKASLQVSFAGTSVNDRDTNNNPRRVKVDINGNNVINQQLAQMAAAVFPNDRSIQLCWLNSSNTNFTFSIINTNQFDDVVVG